MLKPPDFLGFCAPSTTKRASPDRGRSALIETCERRLGESVLPGFPLHFLAGGMSANGKLRAVEREQPEMIVMNSVMVGRTGAAIAKLTEVIDRVPEVLEGFRPARALHEFAPICRNVKDGPVTPDPGGRVGIIAQQDEASCFRWSIRPLQLRRDIRAVAGELAGHRLTVLESQGCQPHDFKSRLWSPENVRPFSHEEPWNISAFPARKGHNPRKWRGTGIRQWGAAWPKKAEKTG